MVMIKERIGKLLTTLATLVRPEAYPISQYEMLALGNKNIDIKDIDNYTWETISNDGVWGGDNAYFWFKSTVTIPKDWCGKPVVYELQTGREGTWDAINPQFTVYVDGIKRQGFDTNHREILLAEQAKGGEQFEILLSAFTGNRNFQLLLKSFLNTVDRKTEHYYYDAFVPYQVCWLLPSDDTTSISILQALNDSLNLLDLRKPHSDLYYESLQRAQDFLTEEFYGKQCGKSVETVACVGHTHIDIAWLWTLAVTRDKAQRSFATVLELMDHYPEYQFISSQPQLYKYVKEADPELYQRIKKRVEEGRWEPEGGMFVEVDCNLSSGESIVRQFLHGKSFFKEEFGVDNKILWLPDVFGYSAALPQIMKKCGIDYFMTTKIAWNEFNKMPCDTFEWEGIDGTRILTHFSPASEFTRNPNTMGEKQRPEHFTTYNGLITPSYVKGSWARYSQKDLNKEVLFCFGYGDGGGGATKDMLETQRRLEKGIPGCPKTKMTSASAFFQRLDSDVRLSKYLPSWVGELYLEYHRGTYTSMARNKKNNRRSEFLLANVELFSCMARQLVLHAYPKDALLEGWEMVLRNQFHDILPGSSVKEVYEDSDREYQQVFQIGNRLQEDALKAICRDIDCKKNDIVVFNPNSMAMTAVAQLPDPQVAIESICDGVNVYPVQRMEEGYLISAGHVPPKGYKSFRSSNVPCETFLNISQNHLENSFVSLDLDEFGQFSSIYDKGNAREVLTAGMKGNVLMTYEDIPHNYDAWDINNYYTEKSWEIKDVQYIQVLETGPVRATLLIRRHYLDSVIKQYISLMYDSAEILIRHEIDWNEKHIFMKELYPIDVHTDEATFEIQYGNVKRKTHKNTLWDFAKFEVCMHKWIDVSEQGYGVSFLNDSKYGCNVHEGVVGISLLKSATYPNPDADREHHSFTISIYPHKDTWHAQHTIQKAYALNNPLQALCKQTNGGNLPKEFSLVSTDEENVVIEVVKESQEGSDTIVRFYESWNKRTRGNLSFGFPIEQAHECDMLENKVKQLEIINGNTIVFHMLPFEIKTIRIKYA